MKSFRKREEERKRKEEKCILKWGERLFKVINEQKREREREREHERKKIAVWVGFFVY
jgi:hypothetical protein